MGGVTQGRVKIPVVNVHQRRHLGYRQQIQLRFSYETERPLGATQDAVEVELPIFGAQVRQVVAGQAAVQFGKGGLDQLGVLALNLIQHPVHGADSVVPLADSLQLLLVQRPRGPVAAVEQYGSQLQHMVRSEEHTSELQSRGQLV